MKTAELFAPENYSNANPELIDEIVNGCGAAGWKVDIVPDNILGIDVSEACNIHDWMYYFGTTIYDKYEADRVFRNNLIRLIEAGSWSRIMKRIRFWFAQRYFNAVHYFGGPAFWNGKNTEVETLVCGV